MKVRARSRFDRSLVCAATGLVLMFGCAGERPGDARAGNGSGAVELDNENVTAAGSDAGADGGENILEPADDQLAASSAGDLAAAGSACKCLGQPIPSCTPTGHITYALKRAANPTPEQQAAYDAISCAMEGAVAYYNCNTTLGGNISVTYNPGVPTAQSSYGGSIAFGKTRGYMVCATAMHEMAHHYGVGTHPKWKSHVGPGSLWVGPSANAVIQAVTQNPRAVIHVAGVHFWPYGLNYASEVKSPADLVDHTKIVVGLRNDLATGSKVNLAQGRPVSASSSHETGAAGWGRVLLTDGERTGKGWSSDNATHKNHTEWVQVDLGTAHPLREVILFSRSDGNSLGYGFPVDFTIDVSTNGNDWTTVVTVTGRALPDAGDPQMYTFSQTPGRFVRVTGTNLVPNPTDKDQYRMQFAEIEVYASGQ